MVIKARMDGKSFCQMTDDESRVASDQIMFRCSALFGCPLPQTDIFAEFISSEMIYFINNFGYEELTLAEIILAIRLNVTGKMKLPSAVTNEPIVFQGSFFNVDFMSKILSHYMAVRNNLDRTLQNHLDGY